MPQDSALENPLTIESLVRTEAPASVMNNETAEDDTGNSINPHTSPQLDEEVSDDETLVNDDTSPGTPNSLSSSELDSDTSSSTSEAFAFVEENGREYNAEIYDPFWAPNDEEERARMDLSHRLWVMILKDHYRAPVQNPQNILDLGCGTGIWVLDVGDIFGCARVKGIDLSPIQPPMVGPNTYFVIDDINRNGVGGRWNFIHARELMGGITDWPKLIRQSFQALEPGGWFESKECSIKLDGKDLDPALVYLTKIMIETGEKTGKDFDICSKLEGWMKEAGFVNVVRESYHVPVWCWPAQPEQRLLGYWNYFRLQRGLDSYCLRNMTRFLGIDYVQAMTDIAGIRRALNDIKTQRQHVTQEFSVIYGQKPL